MKVLVLGLGNLMRTDDGVGIHAIRELSSEGRLPPHIQTVEGGTLGLDLLHSLRGVTHLLALDAVDVGAAPGTLLRFGNAELSALPIAQSVHLLGFADLLGTLKLLDDAPDEVMLLGIQPESTGWGLNLSPSIASALNNLIKHTLIQIASWLAATEEQREPCVSRSQAR